MIPQSFTPARPIEVWWDARDGAPRRLRWRGRTANVTVVEVSWRWDEGWWRGGGEVASRAYHRLVTRDGLRCVVYRDLGSGRWYLEAILD